MMNWLDPIIQIHPSPHFDAHIAIAIHHFTHWHPSLHTLISIISHIGTHDALPLASPLFAPQFNASSGFYHDLHDCTNESPGVCSSSDTVLTLSMARRTLEVGGGQCAVVGLWVVRGSEQMCGEGLGLCFQTVLVIS